MPSHDTMTATAADPVADRETAAQVRIDVALASIEEAQGLLGQAAEALCSVNGLDAQWRRLRALHDQGQARLVRDRRQVGGPPLPGPPHAGPRAERLRGEVASAPRGAPLVIQTENLYLGALGLIRGGELRDVEIRGVGGRRMAVFLIEGPHMDEVEREYHRGASAVDLRLLKSEVTRLKNLAFRALREADALSGS
jgi:hypothetical protein